MTKPHAQPEGERAAIGSITAQLVTEQLAQIGALAAERCRNSAAPLTELAEYRAEQRKFLRTKPARFEAIGRGWRLGVIVVTQTGQLWSSSSSLRAAVPPPHKGYTAESARERDELRHAAVRGGFAPGTVVNYDCAPITAADITADSSPVFLAKNAPGKHQLLVRWSPGCTAEQAPALEAYIAERIELLGYANV